MGAIPETGINGTTTTYSVNNAVSGSASSVLAPSSSQTFYIGVRNEVSQYGSFHWPEIDVVNVVPTSTQIAAMLQYYNDAYGVTLPPGFLYATPVAANTASAPLRIQNSAGRTNYYATTVVSLVSGSTTYTCTESAITGAGSVQSIDVTCPSTPAGTYDLYMQNPDGRSTTYSNAITVTSATNAWTNWGFEVIEWYSAGNITCSSSPCVSGSSTVTSYFDLSAMGQSPTQGTSADQPVWYSGVGDSTFNSQPYALANGSSDQLSFTGLTNDGSATAYVAFGVVHQASSVGPSNHGTWYMPADSTNSLWCMLYEGSGSFTPHPTVETASGTISAVWTATVSGTQNIECDIPSGANPTILVNAQNGTAVTTATSQSANTFGSSAQHTYVHSASGQDYSGASVAQLVFLNTVPTSGQRTAWETYAQSTFGAQ
jgi:hypothetical protein